MRSTTTSQLTVAAAGEQRFEIHNDEPAYCAVHTLACACTRGLCVYLWDNAEAVLVATTTAAQHGAGSTSACVGAGGRGE